MDFWARIETLAYPRSALTKAFDFLSQFMYAGRGI
jgi:hypothetical protein